MVSPRVGLNWVTEYAYTVRTLWKALGNKFYDHHYLLLYVSLSEYKLHGEATLSVSLITVFPCHSTSLKYNCWVNALFSKTSRESTEKLFKILNQNSVFLLNSKATSYKASYKVITYSPLKHQYWLVWKILKSKCPFTLPSTTGV